jgi:hypothetical protein
LKKIVVISNQSLLDLAEQLLGNVDAAFDLALANGLSVTSELEAGQEIIIPESLLKNIDVANYFNGKNNQIATSITLPDEGDLSPNLEGIGYMVIEDTFIVR